MNIDRIPVVRHAKVSMKHLRARFPEQFRGNKLKTKVRTSTHAPQSASSSPSSLSPSSRSLPPKISPKRTSKPHDTTLKSKCHEGSGQGGKRQPPPVLPMKPSKKAKLSKHPGRERTVGQGDMANAVKSCHNEPITQHHTPSPSPSPSPPRKISCKKASEEYDSTLKSKCHQGSEQGSKHQQPSGLPIKPSKKAKTSKRQGKGSSGSHQNDLRATQRVVAKINRYDKEKGKYSVEEVNVPDTSSNLPLRDQIKEIPLRRGGKITIYPNIVSQEACELLQEEIIYSGLFRQYKLQNNIEPRSHFLLHQDATMWTDEKIESQQEQETAEKGREGAERKKSSGDGQQMFENQRRQKQPGYRYAAAKVTMMAKPLSLLPLVQGVSQDLADKCIPWNREKKWTTGVCPILYRDGQDRMGDHADNSQGEELILALLVADPAHCKTEEKRMELQELGTMRKRRRGEIRPRRVVVKPKSSVTLESGDEKIELHLRPGDAYEMDGEMQKHYTHGIPTHRPSVTADKRTPAVHHGDTHEEGREADDGQDVDETGLNNPSATAKGRRNQRMTIIFRIGRQQVFGYDSGWPISDLSPRPPRQHIFGNPPELNLTEGQIYSRMQLYRQNAHIQQQSGMSGKTNVGCTSIVVSGKRADGRGEDTFSRLTYVVEQSKGGAQLKENFEKKIPVRIFRSSDYNSRFRASKEAWQNKKVASTAYRYDGLYDVVQFSAPDDRSQPCKAVLIKQGT